VSRRFRRLHNKSLRKSPTLLSCACRRLSKRYVYLRWPVSVSRNITQVHDPDCPYSVYQSAITDLNVRFSVCSTALRRKIELRIALSHSLDSSSISPGLISYRVVSVTSPGFALLDSFGEMMIYEPENVSWASFAQDLFRSFQNREASPHDRLANGQTLLHVSCHPIHPSVI